MTFLAVAGRRVQLEMFDKFDIPINLERVLHRDQKLIFHRPIMVGDKLWFDSYLDSVIESHGTVIAEVRAEVSDDDGNPVATSIVTMLGEAASGRGRRDQFTDRRGTRRRDRQDDCWAKELSSPRADTKLPLSARKGAVLCLVAGKVRRKTQPKNIFRRPASS